MKQKIQFEVEVPDGKRAVWKDGKVVFEDFKPQLPRTWEEFCKRNEVKEGECFSDEECNIIEVRNGKRHKSSDRNILPNKQAAEAHLALMQLHQLRDCYRQGWEPNWKGDDYKWCISNRCNILYIDFCIFLPNFLSFQSKEIAEEFLNNFIDLIEQAGDLI